MTINYGLLGIAFVFIAILFIFSLAIIIRINYAVKKSSAVLTYSLKVLSFVILLFITILTLPLY